MEFFDVVKSRHSVRAYQDKQVEEEKLKKILEAVNSAPSAGNLQAYEVFVVKNSEKKQILAMAALEQEFIAEAPVVLVFCAHPEKSSWKYGERGKFYSLQDATIAAGYSQLAATNLGLSSVWVGAFSDEEVLKVLGEKNLRPVAIIPLGYPAEEPGASSRRPLNDLVHEV